MIDLDWYFDIKRMGNNLCIRGFRNGEEIRTRVKYEPIIYLENEKDYGFTDIHGKNLKPQAFDNIKELVDFTRSIEGSNLKVYGNPNYSAQYAFENFPDNATKYEKDKIRVFNLDIEVTSTEGFPDARNAAYPMTAICVYDNIADRFVTFGFKEGDGWNKEDSVLPQEMLDKTVYIHCRDEIDLFNKLRNYWNTFTPHVITGWNVEGFDMPYIYNRMVNLGLDPNTLSPWNRASIRDLNTPNGIAQRVAFNGIPIIDYMDRYKKNKVQESYRLDHVASVELGEKKLDYSEVSGLHHLYFENFQKFIDYNIQDVNLVKRLDDKLGLIDAQTMIAYTACLNLDEVNGTVKTWDALIANEMAKENKIIPFHINQEGGAGIPGGHVKDPVVGKHGWVMSFDLASLYPHLIMQFNISPETIKDGYTLWPHDSVENKIQRFLKEEPLVGVPPGYSVSPSGCAFDNSFAGIIPRLMKRLYIQRKEIKGQMLEKRKRGENADFEDLQQYVRKILLNSGYGALTNKHYRWYDRRLGESITCAGQWLIQVAEKNINAWMNKVVGTENVDYVIAIDTDSNYLNCQPLVDKFFADKTQDQIVDILDKIAEEQIEKAIMNGYEHAAQYAQCHEQAMFMDREAIASSAVWTAKKRYAMCVHNNEGVSYDPPKIKIQGLEAIRSSTPGVCRPVLIDIINKILTEDEEHVQQFIAGFKKDYWELPAADIAFPRSMNNIQKFDAGGGKCHKGTPPHVRGAVVHNYNLRKMGIDKQYEEIKSGEKAKFIYLHEPNRLGTHTISFNQQLPAEFDIDSFIDRDKMFEKTVTDPIDSIMQPIGWSSEKRNTLDSFFCM